jgi:hypothetical protein
MSLIIKKNAVVNYIYCTPDRGMYMFTNVQKSKVIALFLAG